MLANPIALEGPFLLAGIGGLIEGLIAFPFLRRSFRSMVDFWVTLLGINLITIIPTLVLAGMMDAAFRGRPAVYAAEIVPLAGEFLLLLAAFGYLRRRGRLASEPARSKVILAVLLANAVTFGLGEAISAPGSAAERKRAVKVGCSSFLKGFQAAQIAYRQDHGVYAPSFEALRNGRTVYLGYREGRDPALRYEVSPDGKRYAISAALRGRPNLGCAMREDGEIRTFDGKPPDLKAMLEETRERR